MHPLRQSLHPPRGSFSFYLQHLQCTVYPLVSRSSLILISDQNGKAQRITYLWVNHSGLLMSPGIIGALVGIPCLGCHPILQTMNRGKLRQKYRLQGSCPEDFLLSCCCGCCALIQEEKESVVRERERAAQASGYQQVAGMKYP